MSNILISCHCKKSFTSTADPTAELHTPLLYKERSKETTPISDDVEYIDVNPMCPSDKKQYTRWADVPRNSKDFIYTINCSIYMLLTNNKMSSPEEKILLTNLLNDGWDILKPGGMIIIPISNKITLYHGSEEKEKTNSDAIQHQLANLQGAIEKYSSHSWQVKSKTSDELPFTILMKGIIYEHFLVIIKHYEGGKRIKKTRSRKIRSRKIRSRKSNKKFA